MSEAAAGLLMPALVLAFMGVYFVVMVAVSRWLDRRRGARRADGYGRRDGAASE